MVRYSSKSQGILLFLLLFLIACHKEDLPPTPFFSVFPSYGDSRTTFYFDARKSTDDKSLIEGLSVRWDWESDSIWDTPFSLQKEYVHRFEASGITIVTMQEMDHYGNTALYRDTLEVWSSIPETGQLIDPRDGQVYKTVKFRNQWVMSENLRYGTWIQDSMMPSQNNGPEYYLYNNDPENLKFGGLYTFYEAMNYRDNENGQGICPEGWHVPSFVEWNSLIGFPNYRTGLGGVPINVPYYYGPKSTSGLEMLFLGLGRLSYPSGGTILTSYGLNVFFGFWTSHPLEVASHSGYGDKHLATSIQLSEYSYMTYYCLIDFDPVLGKNQAAIGLNYLRCIKNK